MKSMNKEKNEKVRTSMNKQQKVVPSSRYYLGSLSVGYLTEFDSRWESGKKYRI